MTKEFYHFKRRVEFVLKWNCALCKESWHLFQQKRHHDATPWILFMCNDIKPRFLWSCGSQNRCLLKHKNSINFMALKFAIVSEKEFFMCAEIFTLQSFIFINTAVARDIYTRWRIRCFLCRQRQKMCWLWADVFYADA